MMILNYKLFQSFKNHVAVEWIYNNLWMIRYVATIVIVYVFVIVLICCSAGRVRKKTKFFHFMDDEGDDDSSRDDEDRDEYQPDSEPEEPGEIFNFVKESFTLVK